MILTSILTCLAIVFVIAILMIRHLSRRRRVWVFLRLGLVMIWGPYLFKAHERLREDAPTAIDLVRDFGVLIVLIIGVVYFDRSRGGRQGEGGEGWKRE